MSVEKYDTGRGQDYECSSGRYVLHSDYAALLARHNALVEELRQCKYEAEVWKKKPAMNVQRKYDALREAVAWERECCQDIRPLVAWARLYVLHGEDYVDAVAEALREIQDAARADVDRLIANETTSDCNGEG